MKLVLDAPNKIAVIIANYTYFKAHNNVLINFRIQHTKVTEQEPAEIMRVSSHKFEQLLSNMIMNVATIANLFSNEQRSSLTSEGRLG